MGICSSQMKTNQAIETTLRQDSARSESVRKTCSSTGTTEMTPRRNRTPPTIMQTLVASEKLTEALDPEEASTTSTVPNSSREQKYTASFDETFQEADLSTTINTNPDTNE